MKRIVSHIKLNLAGAALCLLLLSGCATTTTQDAPETTLEERAMARWDALLGGDLAAAYEFLTPAFRSSVSSLQYQRSILIQKVKWTGAKFIEENCEDTNCKVKISLDLQSSEQFPV